MFSFPAKPLRTQRSRFGYAWRPLRLRERVIVLRTCSSATAADASAPAPLHTATAPRHAQSRIRQCSKQPGAHDSLHVTGGKGNHANLAGRQQRRHGSRDGSTDQNGRRERRQSLRLGLRVRTRQRFLSPGGHAAVLNVEHQNLPCHVAHRRDSSVPRCQRHFHDSSHLDFVPWSISRSVPRMACGPPLACNAL